MSIFKVVLNVNVVSVASDETIFHAVSKTSVVNDETIFHVTSEINAVSVVSDEIIFHIVLNMGVVSVVSDETILHVPSKIREVNNECIFICSLAKHRSQRSQYGFYFYEWAFKTA